MNKKQNLDRLSTAAKQLKYKKDLQELLTYAEGVQKIMRELTKPKNMNLGSKTLENSHDEYIPYILAYSLDNVFGNTILLAEDSQLICTAVLTRSILECMANIAWLHESGGNRSKLAGKTKVLLEQSLKVYDMTSGRIDRVPPLSAQGAGPITARLRMVGSGWPLVYSHLSSFCHMDGGYAVHYHLKETEGVQNACVAFACWSTLESINMLFDLLPLKHGFKDAIKSQYDYTNSIFEKYLEKSALSI